MNNIEIFDESGRRIKLFKLSYLKSLMSKSCFHQRGRFHYELRPFERKTCEIIGNEILNAFQLNRPDIFNDLYDKYLEYIFNGSDSMLNYCCAYNNQPRLNNIIDKILQIHLPNNTIINHIIDLPIYHSYLLNIISNDDFIHFDDENIIYCLRRYFYYETDNDINIFQTLMTNRQLNDNLINNLVICCNEYIQNYIVDKLKYLLRQ
jgi:hypothetical protein